MKQRNKEDRPQFSFSRACTVCNNTLEYYIKLKSYEQEIKTESVLKAQDYADEHLLGKCTIESGYTCNNCRITIAKRVLDYQAKAPYNI